MRAYARARRHCWHRAADGRCPRRSESLSMPAMRTSRPRDCDADRLSCPEGASRRRAHAAKAILPHRCRPRVHSGGIETVVNAQFWIMRLLYMIFVTLSSKKLRARGTRRENSCPTRDPQAVCRFASRRYGGSSDSARSRRQHSRQVKVVAGPVPAICVFDVASRSGHGCPRQAQA